MFSHASVDKGNGSERQYVQKTEMRKKRCCIKIEGKEMIPAICHILCRGTEKKEGGNERKVS